MTGQFPKLPPNRAKRQLSPQGKQAKRSLDDLLDEAREETFPASCLPAMLEPAPDAPRADADRSAKLGP
jgi:hypothetical protein